MCSLTQHSPAAYIASLCLSGFSSLSQHHLASAIQLFNSSVPPSEAINLEALLLNPGAFPPCRLDDNLFKTCHPLLTRLTCSLFPPLMQHRGYLSLLQRVSASISIHPNSRLPLSGGLAWMFLMSPVAHYMP